MKKATLQHTLLNAIYRGEYSYTKHNFKNVISLCRMSKPWKLATNKFSISVSNTYDTKIMFQPSSFDSKTVYLVDIHRIGMKPADNHDSGLHCNVLVSDNDTVHRFDPYESSFVPDTVRMQKALDVLFSKHVPGYIKKPVQTFGPQMLTASAMYKKHNEEYCLPWCLAFAQSVSQTNSFVKAYDHMLNSFHLAIPRNERDAFKKCPQFLKAMRTFTKPIVNIR